jgi:hypothetical protein
MGDQHDLTGVFSWPSNLPKSYFLPFTLAFVCRSAGDHALPCPSLREFRVSP